MHNALLVPLFKLDGNYPLLNFWYFLTYSGCMFHFGQAIQRRVQQAGLARAYIYHVSFTTFVRRLCAISFLPLTEVREAVDELESFMFTNITSPSLLKQLEKFKVEILAYFRRTWLDGSFHPKVFLHLVSVCLLSNRYSEMEFLASDQKPDQ